MTHPYAPRQRTAAVLLLTLAAAMPSRAGCTVSSTGMAFGAYQPLTFAGKLTSAAVTSTATVSVNCDLVNGLLGYTLKLGPSTAGSSISPRYLANATQGGDNMVFNIYTEPTHSTVWGDGVTGSLITHGPLSGTFDHTVYGRIPSGQNTLKAGTFSGTMTITVTYNL
jgi:spore coat protein U-like protein